MLKHALYPAVGLVYVSNGAQLVLLAFMAVSILALPAWAVGIIMGLMFLPQVLLLPFTGNIADRLQPTRVAQLGCVGLSASHFFLVVSIHIWGLHAIALAVYALLVGVFMALFLPAKDKAAVQLLPNRLQKALSLSSAFQFAGIALGTLFAGTVTAIGITGVLITQGLLTALAGAYWRVIPRHVSFLEQAPSPHELDQAMPLRKSYQGAWAQLQAQPLLIHLALLCAFNGFMQMGFAAVLFPILGFKHWGFTSFEYGLMQAVFSVGAVVVYVANAYRKPQKHPGQAALFCLLYAALITYGIAQNPTYWGGFGLIFLWGATAGYSASMSKVVLHTVTNDHERGRAAALYQFILLAVAPLGAMVCGFLLEAYAIELVLVVIAVANAMVFGVFLFSRGLWAVAAKADSDC